VIDEKGPLTRREFAVMVGASLLGLTVSGQVLARSSKEVNVPIVRVSRGSFDPARAGEFEALLKESKKVLVPAIKTLKGLRHY